MDETTIGGHEPGKQGRSHGKKTKVQVAVEAQYPEHTVKVKLLRAKGRIIKDYTSVSLGRAIEDMLSPEAFVVADGFRAYEKAVGSRELIQAPCDKGQNFKELHWYIFNLKNWLRGIHHKVSKAHVQAYINEFNFRFNRRNILKKCPESLLQMFMKLPWLPYSQIVAA